MRNQEELIRQQQALEYYNNRLRQQQAQAQAQAQPRVLSPHEQQVAYYHQQLLLQQQYRDEMQARALREHQQRQEQATAREQLGLYGAMPPTSPYHAQPTPPAAQQPVQPPQYQHQPPASTRPPPPSYYDPNYTVVPSPSSHSQQERASSQEDEELQLALRLSLEESIALGQRQQQQQQQQVAAPSSLPPAYQVRPGGAAPTATTTANATSSASSSYMIPSPEPMSRPRLTAVQRQSMIMMHRSPSRLSFARDSIVIEEASKALDPLGFARYQIPGDGACLFRAVAHQLTGSMAMHGVLRARCVQFMLENADIFRPFLASDEAGETLEQYCEYMARDDSWGGNLEIQALSMLYNVDIEIYSARHDVVVVSNGFAKIVRLWFSQGNHYDCVYSKQELERMRVCQSIVVEMVEKALGLPSSVSENRPLQNYGYLRWIEEMREQELRDRALAVSLQQDEEEHRRLLESEARAMAALQAEEELQMQQLAQMQQEVLRRRQTELEDERLARQLQQIEIQYGPRVVYYEKPHAIEFYDEHQPDGNWNPPQQAPLLPASSQGGARPQRPPEAVAGSPPKGNAPSAVAGGGGAAKPASPQAGVPPTQKKKSGLMAGIKNNAIIKMLTRENENR